MEKERILESLVYNLFKNGIGQFLYMSHYEFLCKENHVKHFKDFSGRYVTQWQNPSTEDMLLDMFKDLYFRDKYKYDEFIVEFFKWYRKARGFIPDLDKSIEYLEQLDVPTVEIESLNTGQQKNVIIKKEGIFFENQIYDVIKLFNSIFKSAKNEIIIIDKYLGEDILSYFERKDKDLKLKLLTKQYVPKLEKLGKAFNKQHGGLEIRESGNFHDRFIIIDGIDFYHVGASISERTNKCFMFSRIEEEWLTKNLMDYFNKEWEKAKLVV